MNLWAVLSLIPGLSHLLLGGYILLRGTKRSLSVTFALFEFSLAIWSMSEFGHRLTTDPTIAHLYIRAGGLGWCFMASLCTHFILILARRERLLRSKLIYLILYGPSSVILCLFLTTDLIYLQEPVKMYFGYTSLPGKFVWVYTLYYILLYSFVIYLLLDMMRRGTTLEKKQTKPVLLGSAVFLSLTTVTNVIFPGLGVMTPELGTFISMVWGASVFYAVVKHKLFIIKPSVEGAMEEPKKYLLKRGLGYLVKERKPDRGYRIFYDQITHGGLGLCISKLTPERVRERYGIIRTPVLWLTFRDAENSISPKDIDGLISVVSDFSRDVEVSVIFLDCFDQVKFANGFEKSLLMLRDFVKLCDENGSIMIMSIPPEMFEHQQMAVIEDELESEIEEL